MLICNTCICIQITVQQNLLQYFKKTTKCSIVFIIEFPFEKWTIQMTIMVWFRSMKWAPGSWYLEHVLSVHLINLCMYYAELWKSPILRKRQDFAEYLRSATVAVPSVHEKGKDSGASVSVAFVVTTLLINATSLMCYVKPPIFWGYVGDLKSSYQCVVELRSEKKK